MSSRKINIRNFFFRNFFFDALNLISLAMRFCRNYTMSNKIYCVNNNFKKCVKCMRSSCDYNLTISLASIKKIYKKRMRLKKEMRDARTKLSRLKK